MPKPRQHRKNYNETGHAHELTFSCYQQFRFFQSDRTCHWFAESLEKARTDLNFELWAFVLMPDHVHLILYPKDNVYDIATIRHAIKSPMARRAIKYLEENAPEWIPRITRRRSGKTERMFWQSGGGYDRNVVEPSTLAKMIDYIHMNPVRKGLVARPEDWKWSSAAWFVGKGPSPIVLDRVPSEWGFQAG